MNAVILKRNGVSYPQRLPKSPFPRYLNFISAAFQNGPGPNGPPDGGGGGGGAPHPCLCP